MNFPHDFLKSRSSQRDKAQPKVSECLSASDRTSFPKITSSNVFHDKPAASNLKGLSYAKHDDATKKDESLLYLSKFPLGFY